MLPTRSLEIISSCRKSVFGSALSLAFVLLPLFATTADAQAQTATIFGALSNFDVVNDTGHDAHGFEIQLEGLQAADIYYTFSAQRYGSPAVVPYATGVYLRWSGAYDASAQQFLQTTVAHAPNTPFAGPCSRGGANYAAGGCDHSGASLRAMLLKPPSRWLVEAPVARGTLAVFDPPVAIPAPTYMIL